MTDSPITHITTTPTASTDTAFYTPPALQADHRPGDILRLRPTPTPRLQNAGPAWQLLYVSRSSYGEPIPVSGIVIAPETAGELAPAPLLVYSPSFHGLGGACAPSQLLATGSEPDTDQISTALARGWRVAVVDGEGLGLVGHGPHTFLAGRAAGDVILDMGRAARRIPALNAAEAPIVLWGYADGGRAAISAGELHQQYAPELDLRGIAAGAVVTDLGEFLRGVDGGEWSGLGVAALLGLACAYRHLPLRHVLTAEARWLLADAETSNAGQLCEWYQLPVATWCVRPDPWGDPMWRYVLARELTGPGPAPTVPVHLYHGNADTLVPAAFSQHLYQDYRAHGARVSLREYDADHFRTARTAVDDVVGQLAEDLTPGDARPT